MTDITISLKRGGDRNLAGSLAAKLNIDVAGTESGTKDILNETMDEKLTVVFDSKGVSLAGYGLTYQGDLTGMLHRITEGRLMHEMLVKAVKSDRQGLRAIDATAGMGEDALLIAAYGYDVTLYEQNPVIAVLLKDSVRRAKRHPLLKDAAGRMHVVTGNSVELLPASLDRTDLVYLDPMFPGRQKTGLINKKLQLIQKLEPPCTMEVELFEAAISAQPDKIVVKRPLKSPHLALKSPNYMLKGKAIRYDCYVLGH